MHGFLLRSKFHAKVKKTIVTQNVMCMCDFNIMFTYVYSGWEGSAHDSKVFLDALTNPNANFPWPTKCKSYINLIFLRYLYLNFYKYLLINLDSFYLVESSYLCTRGFLPSYRGEGYHLQEYQD